MHFGKRPASTDKVRNKGMVPTRAFQHRMTQVALSRILIRIKAPHNAT